MFSQIKKAFSASGSKTSKSGMLGFGVVIIVLLLLWKYGKQIGSFFMGRFKGMFAKNDATKAASTYETAKSNSSNPNYVDQNKLKGVAGKLWSAFHQKPGGFLPRAWFGSTEDETAIYAAFKQVNNGAEARWLSSYFKTKYDKSLASLVTKYLSASERKNIAIEIQNNLQ